MNRTDLLRRKEAAERKLNTALKPLRPTLRPRVSDVRFVGPKSSLETHTHLFYEGKLYRFDYEFDLTQKLPSVKDIRDLLWLSLKEVDTGLWEPTLKRVV